MAAAVTMSSQMAPSPGAAVRFRGVRSRWGALALPGAAALAVFFVVPLAYMLVRSLSDPSPRNYVEVITSSIYLKSYATTLLVAVWTVVVCLVLGYPYAYVMARSSRPISMILGFCVLMPFWMSILVRTYAWTVWLQDNGLINTFLLRLGLIREPMALMGNALGTTVGMAQVLLPFMVLSLVTAMKRIDPALELASRSLGVGPVRTFLRVFLPLSGPGVFAGGLIVFVTALGFYLTPAILGDPTKPLISQLIVERVNTLLDFGGGGALGIILLVLTLVILLIGARFVDLKEIVGLRGES
ncbi:hypothetical protein BIV24_23010 [Streptomyces colonosanans]|uniref:ABC transmembrane type-1 domain-containing protein n=2 Tax=Streptomyces colonosanans TaxID=1428652 RepID=A0A1S2P4J0_9ACTN|nr:hypothetical protein BIV24_23010 [Streptomyces colonosanans]